MTVYVNNASIEASNWDIKIRLGLIESGTPDEINIVDVVHVYMTHEHAKAFAASLVSNLETFERIRSEQTNPKTH